MKESRRGLVRRVAVAEKPTCESDATEVRAGGPAHLTCRLSYSGTPRPPASIKWFVGEDHEDGQELASSDNSVVLNAIH